MTGSNPRPEGIKEFLGARPGYPLFYLAATWAAAAGAAALDLRFGSWWTYPVTVLFIAARQHTLYTLNHEASHGNLFRSGALNRWVSSLFCVFPKFGHPELYSFHQWKRVHVLHHRHLFTAGDPNFVSRADAGDTRRRKTGWALLADCAGYGLRSAAAWLTFRQDHVDPGGRGRVDKYRVPHLLAVAGAPWSDAELRSEAAVRAGFWALVLAGIGSVGGWHVFFWYWIVPLYTAYPMILRLMDLTEHDWTASDPARRTVSTRPNLFEKVFVHDFNRNLHWEHHEWPSVPAHLLPKVHARFGRGPRRAGFFAKDIVPAGASR